MDERQQQELEERREQELDDALAECKAKGVSVETMKTLVFETGARNHKGE